MGSSVLEHASKVRKPYTITKQRGKWTEEEHKKFLEALKLYGRAWRQIEEHVGSKTAVQIRSHAQKFFAKAVRESKTIEIPPPRPKKRPMRPYPRKLGNLPSIAVMEKFPVSEQDNQSPTSVLSSTSDQMNCSTYPVSSVAGSDPVGTLLCEQENGCRSATMSVDDEDESVPQHTSDMELDLGMDDSIPSKIASLVEAPPASLKLFGKTVVVAEPQKPSSLNTENAELATTIDAQKPSSFSTADAEPAITTDVAQQPRSREHEQSITDSVSTFPRGEGGSKWNPWASSMAPMFYFLPSYGNLANSAEAGIVPMPWFWAVSGEHQSSVRECSDNGSVQKESSSADSNSIELTIKNAGARVFNDHGLNDHGGMPVKLRRSGTSAFRSLKIAPEKDTKGFVPYKRCTAEREVKNQKVVSGEDQEQCR